MEADSYIQSLLVSNSLRESTIHTMIKELHLESARLLRIIHLYNVLG